MLSLFTKDITRGAEGTGQGYGRPKKRKRRSFFNSGKTAPSTSLRPKARPTSAPITSIRPKARPTAAPSTSLRPKARPTSTLTTSLRPKARPADLNVAAETRKPPSPPVNISQDKETTGATSPVNVDQDKSSVHAAGQGGGSGTTKASKATEDNVTVKRKQRGTSKYKIAAQPKAKKAPVNNPLILSKKKKGSS